MSNLFSKFDHLQTSKRGSLVSGGSLWDSKYVKNNFLNELNDRVIHPFLDRNSITKGFVCCTQHILWEIVHLIDKYFDVLSKKDVLSQYSIRSGDIQQTRFLNCDPIMLSLPINSNEGIYNPSSVFCNNSHHTLPCCCIEDYLYIQP